MIGYLGFGMSTLPPHCRSIQDCSVYGLASPGELMLASRPIIWVQVPQQSNFSFERQIPSDPCFS